MTRQSSRSDLPLHDWHDRELKNPKQIEVHVQEQPAPSDGQVDWQPGATSQFPWFGFGALITMLLCAASTVIILKSSNGKVAEVWPAYQGYHWVKDSWKETAQLTPSTALAIVNTLYNVALAVAITNGVVIAWWRKALHGATVQDLHQSWAYSTSVFELVTAGKSFNLIALCALTAKLALVDNVLLQQAASTTIGYFSPNVSNFRFPIASELPPHFLGTWSEDGTVGSSSRAFSQNIHDHFANSRYIYTFSNLYEPESYTGFDTHCEGTCFFNVDGFGVNISCSDNVGPTYDVTPQTISQSGKVADLNHTYADGQNAASTLVSTAFESWPAGAQGVDFPDPWIGMTVEYATITSNDTSLNSDGTPAIPTTQTCQGQLTRRTCTVRPALVKYSVVQTNDTATTADSRLFVSRNGLLSPAYRSNSSAYNDIMYSLFRFLSSTFSTTIDLKYLNGTGFTPKCSTSGYIGQFYAQAESKNDFPSSCAITLKDPVDWIQLQLDSILLRASISAAITGPLDGHYQANSKYIVSNITGSREVDTVQYYTQYGWMAAALSVMAVCMMCVLPTYWGYWELGRKVTFGPMEIASAFQAPALNSSVSTTGGGVESVLKEVGQRDIRYGVIGSGGLGIAESRETVRLIPGQPIKTSGDL